jgi:hypothetical protein
LKVPTIWLPARLGDDERGHEAPMPRTVPSTVSMVRPGRVNAPSSASDARSRSPTLRALTAGRTTVQMGYSQPWDGGTKDAWTYSLTVSVR